MALQIKQLDVPLPSQLLEDIANKRDMKKIPSFERKKKDKENPPVQINEGVPRKENAQNLAIPLNPQNELTIIIDGHPHQFLVDTGLNLSALNPDTFARYLPWSKFTTQKVFQITHRCSSNSQPLNYNSGP